MERSWESGSSQSSWSTGSGAWETMEEPAAEERVYVCVPEDFDAGAANMFWVLANFPRDTTTIVITHVHRPSEETGSSEAVDECRQLERLQMNENLDEYVSLCSGFKAAEKLLIEMEDVAEGLVYLIAEHGITNLVMGAAADKHYSENLKVPRSKKALSVMQQADQSCQIWFVCTGILISTRKHSSKSCGVSTAPSASSMSLSSIVEQLGSIPGLQSSREEAVSYPGPLSVPSDKDTEIGSGSSQRLSRNHECEEHLQSPIVHSELKDSMLDAEIYHELRQAITEVGNLKNECLKHFCSLEKAETNLTLVLQQANTIHNLYTKEVIDRKRVQEMLGREKLEVEKLKKQQDEISEQLRKANEQKLALEYRLADSDHKFKELEDKLSAAQDNLQSLRAEHEVLQRDRDNVVEEALLYKREHIVSRTQREINKFSYSELMLATNNLSNSMKIGEGGFGSVYKGFLRNTMVAIKMLKADSLQRHSEFDQEVAILSTVRHPNLVTLIGACPETLALIYEFLPNGSVEDYIVCANTATPLTWQVRTRIIAEVCSALIFLHLNRPHPVVHGDLKPGNILLDANFVSKISDFGISRLLIQSNATFPCCRHTEPKGTFSYMDPEFASSGMLSPLSDVYSFGITILRLLTRRPALGIVREVKEALDKGYLHEIIDPTAGDWPFVQASQLAHLALRCCEIEQKNRPDLVGEVWRVIEPLMKAASASIAPQLSGSVQDNNSNTPSYFICPILQEIMTDPHIAADGFTYEAEAIKAWIDSGHNTSPMTNLELPHSNLTPNRALRSTIQEWLQRWQQQQQS